MAAAMLVALRSCEGQGVTEVVARLRPFALRSLARMYRPDERLFVFRCRRISSGISPEGLSRRHSAISVIGLATDVAENTRRVLAGHDLHDVCGRLMGDVSRLSNLGDVALILWAAEAAGYPDRAWAWERLVELRPDEGTYPTVAIAWALAALCVAGQAPVGDLRERLAHRLVAAFDRRSGIFPHVIRRVGWRVGSHVSCFADLVHPVYALALYHRLSGDPDVQRAAILCAEHFCRQQGSRGQWWWQYDRRTGRVVERYPVYAAHQDALAPLALFALGDAVGADYADPIARGLAWLARSPELSGGSLIDESADLIWRKVGRREPGKLSGCVQAVVSGIHASMRIPGLDVVFPPGIVDYEDRPDHLGWLLYAWPAWRVASWAPEVPRQ